MSRIPVFYVPAMVGHPAGSYSPSAGKPAEVVADWLADSRIAPHIEIIAFEPVSRAMFGAAHDPRYVDNVLELRAMNGFSEVSESVALSLPYTSGSMLAAALHVLDEPRRTQALRLACSPTSGFHHANHDHGHGFCTFNGLMVAAIELKRRDLVDRVLILDCDQHYGDGTQDIIEHLGLGFITHVTHATHAGRAFGCYRNKAQLTEFITEWLPQFAGPRSIVLYQAGADCHVADPLGGFLTTEEMRQRDALVFTLARRHRVPLVWNLAGGYQRDANGTIAPVLRLHRNTVIEAIASLAG